MPRSLPGSQAVALVEACRRRSLELLGRNLAPHGIRAAARGRRAAARGYDAVFGRDAAVCALGMALSGEARLRAGAVTGLATLAAHQAPNGQIPNFVAPGRREADFWYLGCIDATLWWLIAVDGLGLRRRFAPAVRRALGWLAGQEHQRFHLLQQNEASDWADIMPRWGFVLYTNALWYLVKRRYGLPHAARTRASCNHLFRPFDAPLAEYRRARLLAGYARARARNRGLYLSFVSLAAFGDEGDVLGNLLAVLCGLADAAAARRIVRSLQRAGVDRPHPVRAVCDPIPRRSPQWRPYMARHRQNLAWQYHNGGAWPLLGGLWVAVLAQAGMRAQAAHALERLAHANALEDWGFTEWRHGRSGAPGGMRGQSWNAGAFLIACAALRGARVLSPAAPRRGSSRKPAPARSRRPLPSPPRR